MLCSFNHQFSETNAYYRDTLTKLDKALNQIMTCLYHNTRSTEVELHLSVLFNIPESLNYLKTKSQEIALLTK